MKLCIGIAGLLIASNCFARQSNNSAGSPKEITYCQLIENPSAFVGKRIQVRAIYSYFFEVSRFKAPECCPGRDVSIWVEFDEDLEGKSKTLYGKFPKGMGSVLATFVGMLNGGGPYGDGGYRFLFTVERIEDLEHKAKPRLHHFPAWIPNCEAPPALKHEADLESQLCGKDSGTNL